MRRLILPLAIAALCAVGLWGCGSVPTTIAGKPWLKRGVATSDRMETPSRNPLRKRTDSKRPSRELAEADRQLTESVHSKQDEKPLSRNEKLAKFDPETLQLIEDELAATPPEEREDFFEVVLSLQPAMVRQFIHTRRVVRQVGQDSPGRFVASEQQIGSRRNPVQLVAGERSPTDGRSSVNSQDPSQNVMGRNPSRDPGLGAVDPWNRQTQPGQRAATGGWANDSQKPPAPLPFNQIPALPATGHSAGYTPGNSNPVQIEAKDFVTRNPQTPPQVQPPPGGASTPVNQNRDPISGIPNRPRRFQNARIPTDYNPLTPPVPNYTERGTDPFAAKNAPPIRTASQNPNQRLMGVANSLGLGDSFGPPSNDRGNEIANQPNIVASPASEKADLNRIIAAMEAEVAGLRYADLAEPTQKVAYVRKHVDLRMLYLMSGQEARAVAAIPDIPAPDQEFWQQTFWAMSNYFDTNSMPDSDYRATQTIAQLRTAIQKLQEHARLELRSVAFCHKISSFGNFDRFQQDEFGPGQPVLVYAEVANFKSEPTALPNKPNQMAYRTQLKSSIEIHRLGPSGDLVERFEFEPTEDLCHNHRRDYFHSYEFTIPQRISLGPHVMTLTVEDQLSRKVATYRLNFMVK